MRVLALAAVAHMLRSRRFHERVGVVVVVLAALARMIRENQASTRARPAGRMSGSPGASGRKAKARRRAAQGSPPGN
jgi:hypothetical protein